MVIEIAQLSNLYFGMVSKRDTITFAHIICVHNYDRFKKKSFPTNKNPLIATPIKNSSRFL